MLVKTIPVGYLGTNCYVVTDENTCECAVIDPGAESNTILDYIEDNKLTCRAIMLTHGHFDHVMALGPVMGATGATVYVNAREEGNVVGHPGMGFKAPAGTVYYSDGDAVKVAGLTFKVIDTPGHTPGGVTLLCEDAMFSGDTLFCGSCGRTDFPGGDMMEQLRSLKKLAELEGDYDVYPGHDVATTLARERAYNPYVIRAVEGFE